MDTIRELARSIPASRMEWPNTRKDRLKYLAWRLYTPLHPHVRDVSLALRFLRHEGRQRFLIGTLDTSRDLSELVAHLIKDGYRNHFVAWEDDGEIVSLRKTCGFTHQYHVRIFLDGEIRAHYEYTPEYRPIKHLRAIGMEDRREVFTELFKGWLR